MPSRRKHDKTKELFLWTTISWMNCSLLLLMFFLCYPTTLHAPTFSVCFVCTKVFHICVLFLSFNLPLPPSFPPPNRNKKPIEKLFQNYLWLYLFNTQQKKNKHWNLYGKTFPLLSVNNKIKHKNIKMKMK